MKIRIAFMVSLALAYAPTTMADDSEKLDTILKELRELKERVILLERKVQRLSPAPIPHVKVIKTGDPLIQEPVIRESYRFKPLPSRQVEEVLRLQIQSPGSLLKGIHERERALRNRTFLPDVVFP